MHGTELQLDSARLDIFMSVWPVWHFLDQAMLQREVLISGDSPYAYLATHGICNAHSSGLRLRFHCHGSAMAVAMVVAMAVAMAAAMTEPW